MPCCVDNNVTKAADKAKLKLINDYERSRAAIVELCIMIHQIICLVNVCQSQLNLLLCYTKNHLFC